MNSESDVNGRVFYSFGVNADTGAVFENRIQTGSIPATIVSGAVILGHRQSLRANNGSLIIVSLVVWVPGWVLRSYAASQFTRLRAFFIFLGFLRGFFLFWGHTRLFLRFFVALLFFTHDVCPSVRSNSQPLSEI